MEDPESVILLVEDDESHAELVARAFERAGEHRLLIARSLRQARGTLLELSRAPDLVIADFRLPDGSGTELITRSGSPVVVLTSHGDQTIAVEAMKAGAFDYLVKSESTFADMPHIVSRNLEQWRLAQEHARLEEDRRRSNTLLRRVLENSPIRAQIQDTDLRITWSYHPKRGFAQQEALGQTDHDQMPSESAERVAAIKRKVLETGEAFRDEVPLVLDGEGAVVDLSVSPHRDATGAIQELFCVSVDVTERRRLEQELADRERLASVGMAASILAHEIGNPLNNMFLTAQMLQRQLGKTAASDERVGERLGTIVSEIRRLSHLLTEFRSTTRREGLERRPMDLGVLLESVLDSVALRASEAGVRIRRELPSDLTLEGHADKLTQVFLNLCKNAIEAMPSGGELSVRVRREDGALTTEVSDTGSGIAAGFDVFHPFKTTKPDGTGLGLAVVRQLVIAHGGNISYESHGGGTTFRVTLPIAAPRPSARPSPT